MTTKNQRTVEFDATADALREILTSPDFLVAEQESDPGNESAQYRDISRTDDRLKYEMQIVEYGRSMKGVIDRNKRDQSRVTSDWDLKARRCTWTYKNVTSSWSDRFRCSGETRIEPAGNRARLISSFEVEGKIPLAGKVLEKLIVGEFTQGYQRYDDLVREYVRKRK